MNVLHYSRLFQSFSEMAQQLTAKVAALPAAPLAHPAPMDLDAQEEVSRDKRDMDFLREKFSEVASIESDVAALAAQLPTVVDSSEACKAVAELALMHDTLKAMADPDTPDATRGAKIASTMIKDMFDSALKSHKILTIVPVCIKHYQLKGVEDAEETARRDQVLTTYNQTKNRTKITHHAILPYLAKINRETFSLCCKASRNVPLAALSLNEHMLQDAKTHSSFLLAINHIPVVHKHCFANLAQDGGESSWNRYVGSQGKVAHPRRSHSDPHPVFVAARWTKSVIHHDQFANEECEALAVDHVLPSYAGLKRCFRKMEGDKFSSNRKSPYDARNRSHQPRYYYLERDIVSHLALLFGDIVYKMMLFTDRIPALAAGKAHAFPERDLPSAIVTLGIFLHMSLSYQTCLLKVTYDPFEVIDLSAIFDYPPAEAVDQLKMITYCFRQNLGEKRFKALPFLLQARGMRGYGDFLRDPDAWVVHGRGH